MKFAKTPLMVAGAFVVAMATPVTPLLAASVSDTFTVSLTLQDLLEVSCTDFNFGTLYRSSSQSANVVVRVTGPALTLEGTGMTAGSGGAGTSCTIKGLTASTASAVLSGPVGTIWTGNGGLGNGELSVIPLTNGLATPLYADLALTTTTGSFGNGNHLIRGQVSIPYDAALGTYTSGTITFTVTE